jgi:hypothetical protein
MKISSYRTNDRDLRSLSFEFLRRFLRDCKRRFSLVHRIWGLYILKSYSHPHRKAYKMWKKKVQTVRIFLKAFRLHNAHVKSLNFSILHDIKTNLNKFGSISLIRDVFKMDWCLTAFFSMENNFKIWLDSANSHTIDQKLQYNWTLKQSWNFPAGKMYCKLSAIIVSSYKSLAISRHTLQQQLTVWKKL